jgi:hypothetical protein
MLFLIQEKNFSKKPAVKFAEFLLRFERIICDFAFKRKVELTTAYSLTKQLWVRQLNA